MGFCIFSEIGSPWLPRSATHQSWFFSFPTMPRWSAFCRFSSRRIFLVVACSVPSSPSLLPVFIICPLYYCFASLLVFCLKSLLELWDLLLKKQKNKKTSQINLPRTLTDHLSTHFILGLLPALPARFCSRLKGFGGRGHSLLLPWCLSALLNHSDLLYVTVTLRLSG